MRMHASVRWLRYSVLLEFDQNYREMDKPAAEAISVAHARAPAVVTRRNRYPADAHVKPHWHDRAQFQCGSSGVMRVATRRRLWVVPPMRALWIPARTVHEIRMSSAVDMRSLYIDAALVRGMPDDCAVLDMTALMRELVVRASTDAPSTRDAPQRHEASDGALDEEYGLLSALMVAELRRLPRCGLDLPLPESAALRGLCERALADLSAFDSAQAQARRLKLSARTLYRRFLDETGLSFARWIQQARLLDAVRRLGDGQAVTDVALDLGYQSPSAFTAMFNRALGCSPREWRRLGEGRE